LPSSAAATTAARATMMAKIRVRRNVIGNACPGPQLTVRPSVEGANYKSENLRRIP
jgi:hypothetical protein